MTKRALPDQTLLLRLLRYEPDTGKLFWRERTPDTFQDDLRFSPEIRCRRWNRQFAGREAFTASSSDGALVGSVAGIASLKAHRVIWCMVHGEWPEMIGHVNKDLGDNRICNLAITDRLSSARHSRLSARNRSGRIGVYRKKGEKHWRAKIHYDGRYIQLGRFALLEDAYRAREAAEKLYGYSPLHGRRVSR